MKHLLLCATILIRTFAMAGNTDSTLLRHTFSISMANGVSQQFFDGPGSRPATGWSINTPYSPGEFSPNYRVNFTPMYASHIQVHYSLGLSSFVRLETGVGYLLSGSTCSYSLSDFIAGSNPNHYYTFSGAITLPIYIQFIKPMRHGAFTCTLGPDFDLPVHTFYYNPSGMILDEQELTLGHRHYSTTETVQLSTMGFTSNWAMKKGCVRVIL